MRNFIIVGRPNIITAEKKNNVFCLLIKKTLIFQKTSIFKNFSTKVIYQWIHKHDLIIKLGQINSDIRKKNPPSDLESYILILENKLTIGMKALFSLICHNFYLEYFLSFKKNGENIWTLHQKNAQMANMHTKRHSILWILSSWSLKKKVLKRRKEQKKFNRYSREDFLKSKKAHEKMFNIISHQGNAIKTTNRYYHTSIRKDDDKEADHISVGRGVEKMKPSYLASGGNVIWHNHLQQSDSFLWS